MTAPLRVLVLTPLGHRGRGGVDRVMDNLRPVLAARADVEARFLTTRGASVWASLARTPSAAVEIAASALFRRVDVVHVNLASNASAYRKAALCALCRSLRLPYVLHLHGADFREFWPRKPGALRAMLDRMFRGAAAVVVLGDVWRDMVAERLPDLQDRLVVVPNGAPARPPVARAGRPGPVRVLFLGRLGERKGSTALLRALARISDTPTPWRATLAGDGARESARRLATELGIADRLDVRGWVDPAEVDRLLELADVLTLPSLSENLPMAVIEGMAAGLPVVTTPVGATPDIVQDGETGLFAPPADVAALADALRRTIEDPALRARLGDAARAFHAARLDVGPFAERLVEVWRRAAA